MEPKGIRASILHGEVSQLGRLTREALEYLEGWKRARADYENLLRRSEEERRAARSEGVQAALHALLRVAEHFDAAFASVPEELRNHPWVEGVRYTHKAFLQALAAEGIRAVDAPGVTFDPSRHEAIERVPSAEPEGTVIEIISKGYLYEGKTLRSAKVKVSAGRSAEESRTPAAAVVRGDTSRPSTSKTPNTRKEK